MNKIGNLLQMSVVTVSPLVINIVGSCASLLTLLHLMRITTKGMMPAMQKQAQREYVDRLGMN
jgi:hypothetical protein